MLVNCSEMCAVTNFCLLTVNASDHLDNVNQDLFYTYIMYMQNTQAEYILYRITQE